VVSRPSVVTVSSFGRQKFVVDSLTAVTGEVATVWVHCLSIGWVGPGPRFDHLPLPIYELLC